MRALLVLALLLAAPIAAAGTPEEPEVVDERGDVPDTAADILSAWLAYEDAGVRFSIRTADGSRPDLYPGFVYWIEFRAGGVTSSALIGFDARGRMHGHIGPLDGPDYDRGDIGAFANERVKSITQARGTPSTWSGVLPWGAVPGLRPGATLIDIEVGSARFDGGWSGALDRARTDRAWLATEDVTLLTHPAFVPSVLGVATAGGAAGGWWMLRRLRAAKA